VPETLHLLDIIFCDFCKKAWSFWNTYNKYFDFLFRSAQVQESLEQTKFENDVQDHPTLPELQLLQSINTNLSDPTTIVEKDRMILEAIQKLQKFREQLMQDHRQQNKVSFIFGFCRDSCSEY